MDGAVKLDTRKGGSLALHWKMTPQQVQNRFIRSGDGLSTKLQIATGMKPSSKKKKPPVMTLVLPPLSKDFQNVLEFFNTHLGGEGYTVTQITECFNPGLVSAFIDKRKRLKQQQRLAPELFNMKDWRLFQNAEQREQIFQTFEAKIQSFKWNAGNSVPIIPVVHATSEDSAHTIIKTGFATLSSLDSGFYGQGMYFTTDAAYIAPYAAQNPKPCILLCYLIPGNSFPVTENPMHPNSLRGLALKPGYQSHYVLVNASGMVAAEGETNIYDEIVVNQDTQVLPAYILTLDPLNFGPALERLNEHKRNIKKSSPPSSDTKTPSLNQSQSETTSESSTKVIRRRASSLGCKTLSETKTEQLSRPRLPAQPIATRQKRSLGHNSGEEIVGSEGTSIEPENPFTASKPIPQQRLQTSPILPSPLQPKPTQQNPVQQNSTQQIPAQRPVPRIPPPQNLEHNHGPHGFAHRNPTQQRGPTQSPEQRSPIQRAPVTQNAQRSPIQQGAPQQTPPQRSPTQQSPEQRSPNQQNVQRRPAQLNLSQGSETQGTQGITQAQGTQGIQETQGTQTTQATPGTKATQGIKVTQETPGMQGISDKCRPSSEPSRMGRHIKTDTPLPGCIGQGELPQQVPVTTMTPRTQDISNTQESADTDSLLNPKHVENSDSEEEAKSEEVDLYSFCQYVIPSGPSHARTTGPGTAGPGAIGPGTTGATRSGTAGTGPGMSGPGISGPGFSGPGISGPRIHGPGAYGRAWSGQRVFGIDRNQSDER
eukprot:TRINITY_DN150_c1_g1_i10.p1 TRINITY_DN150_c1_g1~~TRINITY_DN150_c1_g1_i10.p1  ORF type:complete len:764 (-),score=100.45 TRINITY_DN150_c1_g1_i10:18-2309(-)